MDDDDLYCSCGSLYDDCDPDYCFDNPQSYFYPEPRTWDDIEDDIASAFTGQMKNLDAAFTREAPKYAPTWWMLVTACPEDIRIEEDVERADVTWGDIRRPIITNHRNLYLAWGEDNRHPIYAYFQRVDFDKQLSWISDVQMVEPPAWGLWMPSLIGV
ncbi:hypothetical protein PBI_MANDA_72 [Mycobacterium phage Manda]|nr:hypothetical protein PBI_MANDA_72 [Mycobacterium phage Manda]